MSLPEHCIKKNIARDFMTNHKMLGGVDFMAVRMRNVTTIHSPFSMVSALESTTNAFQELAELG